MQVEQIEVADFVVLNKMDLLEKQGGGAEKRVRRSVRVRLQPSCSCTVKPMSVAHSPVAAEQCTHRVSHP